MGLRLERVHNELEAKVLIEEAFSRGDEEKYQGTIFETHDGDRLFKCEINLTEYTMHKNDHSITVEL